MSHASYDQEDRAAHGISDGLIRLAVGLEDREDLRDDLAQAFSAARGQSNVSGAIDTAEALMGGQLGGSCRVGHTELP